MGTILENIVLAITQQWFGSIFAKFYSMKMQKPRVMTGECEKLQNLKL